jgi:hypothetical protein
MTDPAIWNRTVYRGTDHDWPLRMVTDEGEPIIPDLAHAQLRDRVGGDVWLDLWSYPGEGARITIDEVEGWVHLIIPEEDTASVDWNERRVGVWDIEVTVGDDIARWAQGSIRVSQDVTRSLV